MTDCSESLVENGYREHRFREGVMSASKTVEGTGSSLEEAIKQALNNVDTGNGADILVILQVEKFGIKAGGIAGISEFWVKATYTLD